MKTKFNRKSRNLMVAMLIGDGSINSVNGFRMTHCEKQINYLNWKIKELNSVGVRNCGLKSYVSTQGYKIGETYYYTRLNVTPFIKVLRRVFYKSKFKDIANRKMLNRLDAKGIAIWYMDDGCLNHRKDIGIYIRLATCLQKDKLQVLINYFKEEWNISFYSISEGKGTYSLCCGTAEAIKFIDIVKPYVSQIPEMHYKILYNIRGRKRPVDPSGSKLEALEFSSEDIVCSASKDAAVNNGVKLTTLHEHKSTM